MPPACHVAVGVRGPLCFPAVSAFSLQPFPISLAFRRSLLSRPKQRKIGKGAVGISLHCLSAFTAFPTRIRPSSAKPTARSPLPFGVHCFPDDKFATALVEESVVSIAFRRSLLSRFRLWRCNTLLPKKARPKKVKPWVWRLADGLGGTPRDWILPLTLFALWQLRPRSNVPWFCH